MTRTSRGFSRRAFVRSAIAIGGASALAACIERGDSVDLPQASVDPAALPARQHAWNEYLPTDEHGNDVAPEHHVLLQLEYTGDEPTEEERNRMETALQTLERAYEFGSDGLAFTVGYGPSYFERFDESLPLSVDLPEPKPLSPAEDPELDRADVLVHLASNYGEVVISAEEALTGELGELNGIDVETSFEELFEVTDRRTGFIGEGIPASEQEDVSAIPDSDPVPEDSPLFMGFKSGFEKNQASEDRVTIRDGPFAGGTTAHLSKIHLDLHQWYVQDSRDQRVGKMFCPVHAEEDRVEGAGDNLGNSSQIDDCAETLEADASSGVVGHSQKVAQVRDDDEPLLLRRDFNSTDDDQAGTHFLSLQRTISAFVRTREAMNGEELSVPRANSGILQYLDVHNRANYLVPPREHRSLPTPNPE